MCELQTCRFLYSDWATSVLGTISLYSCQIENAKLLNENETVVTNTKNNQLSDEDVQAVEYSNLNKLAFIPNSIFQIFPLLQLLFISQAELKILKPHFFENATELTILEISQNYIEHLQANLFRGASNLQNLNLKMNDIKSIDFLTFSGLFKLVVINLSDNKLKKLSPKTFSHLLNLEILMMTGNGWIDMDFNDASGQFSVIEAEIDKNCEGIQADLTGSAGILSLKIIHLILAIKIFTVYLS